MNHFSGRSWRRGITTIGELMVALTLVSCSAPIPTAQELIGEWTKSEDGGSLTFYADGSFEARGIPGNVIEYDQSPAPFSGEGSWTVEGADPARTAGGTPIIDVRFSPAPSGKVFTTQLLVDGSGESRRLYFTMGDPDLWDRYILDR